jgi:glutathione S-transferase
VTLQLFSSAASPFARKVRVVILECGLADRVEIVPVQTTPLEQDAKLVRANPVGKVPALVRDDGPAVYDSRVITRYLDAIAAASLYPSARLWEVLTLEATADGVLDAAVLLTYERRFREEGMQSEGWIQGQRQRIHRTLDALGERWMSHLKGRLDIGQIGTGCALSYLDFRHPDMNWREGRSALAEWFAGFAERDSMKATEPQG